MQTKTRKYWCLYRFLTYQDMFLFTIQMQCGQTSWIFQNMLRVMGSHWTLHMHVLNTSKWGPWELWWHRCKSQTHWSRQRSSCECDGKGWICRVVVLTEPGFTLLIVKPVHSWGETESQVKNEETAANNTHSNSDMQTLKNMVKFYYFVVYFCSKVWVGKIFLSFWKKFYAHWVIITVN